MPLLEPKDRRALDNVKPLAQHVAERRALYRFRTEQPPYSILARGIERSVLPVAQRHGMGVMTWIPLAWGLLTGRHRKGRTPDYTVGRAKIAPARFVVDDPAYQAFLKMQRTPYIPSPERERFSEY